MSGPGDLVEIAAVTNSGRSPAPARRSSRMRYWPLSSAPHPGHMRRLV